MKSALVFLAIVVMSAAIFTTLKHQSGAPRTPFYLADIEAMRALPEEDLLRMRDDIFSKSAGLPDVEVRDQPRTESQREWTGNLVGTTDTRPASGLVSVLRLPDGTLMARLENFRLPHAPDLRLILAGESTAEVGSLRGNVGSQNFKLPPGWRPGRSPCAVIRSVLFQADFAEAPLAPEPDKS